MGLLVTLAGAAFMAGTAHARGFRSESLGSVSLSSLPPEGQNLYRLILAGGPFPSRSKDGVVFGNRERILPRAERGFYHEYTVPTPGASDRGARRIVCGGNPPTNPQACYYTADHYASFRMIVQ
jgi:ribonuclease T1